MGVEIERKYKVDSDEWRDQSHDSVLIIQGYLNEDGCVVRARIKGDKGYLTVKEKRSTALVRLEFEYEIPPADAARMIKEFCDERIVKMRHFVDVNGHEWVIDEFLEDNEGLEVAEIELEHEDEDFDVPEWAGDEVTDTKKFSNTTLSKTPYQTWE